MTTTTTASSSEQGPGSPGVTLTIDGRTAIVQLNRPRKLNALNVEMLEALVTAGQSLMAQPEVAAVLLCGAGRSFCAGLDLQQIEQMRAGTADAVQLGDRLGAARALAQKAVHVWSMVPVPVVAAVQGVAFGGGLQLALGADIRVVAPDARLAALEIQWGLVPDMAGTQLLPELVGRDVAKDMIFTGREVSGTEARDLGLATRIAIDPVAAGIELVEQLASRSRTALSHAKRLIDAAGRVELAIGLDAEQVAIAELIGSEEQSRIVTDRLSRVHRR
ncbi:crotonase/enoyl-CoA hydratase family protein [Rhodococcus sp. 24CO]|uniref:crotonase/enoyl-CoA hydratase family protein n=1 Tax=Rhodococcus sp. 24CO TaxID=3117460 RepID=UPI003D3507CE